MNATLLPQGTAALVSMLAVFSVHLLTGCTAPDACYVVNAKIWTGDPDRPWATTCAIVGDVFRYVGDREGDAAKSAGINSRARDERRIDARGAVIIPGIIDSHLHLVSGGQQLLRLDLRDVPDRTVFIAAIAERARRTPKGRWILGGRWSTESWSDPAQPSRDWIDSVTPDHPVLLERMDGHGALVNNVALRMAGIDANGPPDPPGGKIERDASGEPTGIVKDTAIDLIARLVPTPTDDELDAALAAAMVEANRHGITTVHTMSPYNELAVIDRARDAGQLTLRVRYYVSEDDWESYLDRAVAHRDDTWVDVCGIKQYADGSMGSRTALMAEPYSDNPPDKADWRGLARPALIGIHQGTMNGDDPDTTIEQICKKVRTTGLVPAVHAIGDQANHLVLNIFEGAFGADRSHHHKALAFAPGEGWAAPSAVNASAGTVRPRIEHAQHLLPRDIARFAQLGVVASMQPLHKADDGRYVEPVVGAERCKTSYAFRSLLDAGAPLAFGSDWPVVSLNPFRGMHAAVTARTLDGELFVPDQRITVEEALRAYTAGGAYATMEEGRLGRIMPGYLGDFVILEDDPFTIDPEDFEGVRVRATYVGGRCVWSRLDGAADHTKALRKARND